MVNLFRHNNLIYLIIFRSVSLSRELGFCQVVCFVLILYGILYQDVWIYIWKSLLLLRCLNVFFCVCISIPICLYNWIFLCLFEWLYLSFRLSLCLCWWLYLCLLGCAQVYLDELMSFLIKEIESLHATTSDFRITLSLDSIVVDLNTDISN